ncbi:OFA family MFS transporter [Candidatus Acetothermia bacterium]|jgi:OFA family oxalate/formate antiporter-like MFS transporter|nr:OFA family MFS transporter [Candidatus Acetothermia bacterium]MCI2435781.1 OFA family MFS transporter [Candidatus Acetothermia bacterium]
MKTSLNATVVSVQEERLPNRWLFVVAAVLMQLGLGNVYAWSIFRNPLMSLHGWTIQEATMPFTLCVVFFAVGMIVAGRWQDRVGPRIVAVTGGILLSAGFLLASQLGQTLLGLYLTYGVLVGLGVGFAYVTPIATCVKWFPDMRGFITGLAVLGFGAGSLIVAPVGTTLISQIGVYGTLAVFGVTFGLLVMLTGAMLRNPPTGWKPAGWTPPANGPGSQEHRDHPPSQMAKTFQFYLLWVVFLFWAGVGLMVISQAVPMGQELADLSAPVAAGALGVMSILNGLGRPAFGFVSDKIGRIGATLLAQAVFIVTLLLVLPNARDFALYTLGISLIGFAYGGSLSVLPAFIADYYGTKHLGINYGWVFSAWGAAGVLGPIIGAQVRAATGAWGGAFMVLAILSAVAALLILIAKPPRSRG